MRVFNSKGETVACVPDVSATEALNMAYRWNADETREHMTVTRVQVDGASYDIAVQGSIITAYRMRER